MNTGFRSIGYAGNNARGQITDSEIVGEPKPTGPDRQGRRIGLAEYFSVVPLTVVSWLTQPGQYPRARNIVVPRDGQIGSNPPYVGAIGRRLVCLKSDQLEGKSDPLNGLRDRIVLAALLGVQGGIYREPILTGRASMRTWTFQTLPACIRTFKTIWEGEQGRFYDQAWTTFYISGRAGNWTLTMLYNQKENNQEFYNEEMYDATDDLPGEVAPGCP